jgi:exonuclease SbcD
MRILHTSDWHLGRSLENISRIEEQREFIDQLCDIADEERIDLVLVAGDVYDSYNPSAAAEELFYYALDRLNDGGGRAVVVIAGNHDNPERLCASNPLASKNGIILLGYPGSRAGVNKYGSAKTGVVDSGAGWLEVGISRCGHTAVIIALPYPSEARLEQLLTRETDEKTLQRAYSDRVGSIISALSRKYRADTVNLALSHLFMSGGKQSESERVLQVGGALTVEPEVLPARAHFTALGHLHRPQQVKSAPCPAYYSGSPLAYSFSESDYAKALYIIDAAPGKPADIRELYLSCGRPLKRWIAVNGIEEALRWAAEGRDKNAWIDLEVHTDSIITIEQQKTLRELNPGILNIRPVIRQQDCLLPAWESRETKSVDQLFREYYLYKTKTEISEELMSTFLDILNDSDDLEDENAGGDGYEAQVP